MLLENEEFKRLRWLVHGLLVIQVFLQKRLYKAIGTKTQDLFIICIKYIHVFDHIIVFLQAIFADVQGTDQFWMDSKLLQRYDDIH